MPRIESLKLNLALLYGAELVGKLLGLAVFGFLGRMLQQARYGDLEFAIAILFLLNLFLEAGLAPYGAREAARRPERTAALASQIMVIRTGLLCCALTILTVLWLTLDRDPVARQLIALYGLVLIPVPLLLNWAFQARDEMGVVAGCGVLRQLILAGITFYMVRAPEDVVWVPAADALGLLCAVLVQQWLFHRRSGALFPLRHLDGLGKAFRESLPIAGSSVVWSLRMFFPLIALGLFTSSAATGVFGAGHRLIVALHTFVWLYFFNLLPSISRVAHRADLGDYRRLISASFTIVAWVVLAGACVGGAIAPALIPLIYGDGLAEAARPFAIMLWMLVAAFLSGHQRFSLIALEEQRRELVASIVGGVVSVGACLALADRLSPELAAFVFVAGEGATFAAAALMLRGRVGSLALRSSLARPVLVAAAVLAALWVLQPGPWLGGALSFAGFGLGLALFGRDALERFRDLRVAGAEPDAQARAVA